MRSTGSTVTGASRAIVGILAAAAVLIGTAGCAWVELSPAGEQIQVSAPEAVAACERIGRTKTRTQTKAWIFPRRSEKVSEELRNLARDDAAEMGGTDVTPVGEPEDGRQEFNIYRCEGSGGA